MSNDYFDDFRRLQDADKLATDRNAAKFIFRGSMATTINFAGTEYQVGFVYNNREEEDKAYLYIFKPIQLPIGGVFTWTDHNNVPHQYLIYDEEKSVKRVIYNKYLCFECNVQVDDAWGYLSGPRSTYINTQLRQMLYEVSLAKPVLIMGSSYSDFEIAHILEIGGRNWRVIEKDNYSAPGLVYYYLEQFVAQKDSDITSLDFKPEEEDPEVWKPGQEITLKTVDGYFESTPAVKARITPTTVSFTVPYDTDEITVVYKTEDEIVTDTYKVVM